MDPSPTLFALTHNRRFDSHRQKVLMRYYVDAGADGVAVGMHFTQFEIRNPGIGLFEPVLKTCAAELDRLEKDRGRPLIKIAGINGLTTSALGQARLARDLGYDFAIISMAAFDANAAIFDAAHNYAGSIPGVNEILHRQGLLECIKTLKPHEVLSPGQMAEIDRVCATYPHLTDNAFVAANLEHWLAES